MVRTYLLPVLLLPGLVAVPRAAAEEPVAQGALPEAAAVVGDRPIPYDAFVEGLIRRHGKAYLEELIVDTLLEIDFERHGIRVTPDEVDAAIAADADTELSARSEQVKKQDGVDLAEYLRRTHSSPAQYRTALIEARQKDRDLFAKQVKADKLIALFLLQRTRVQVQHIRVNTRSEAEQLLQRIHDPDSGETFSTAYARIMSGKGGSAPHELDPFGESDYTLHDVRPELAFYGPTFSETAFSLMEGDVSEIFHTDAGWHILRVVNKYPAREGSYRETLKDEVDRWIRVHGAPTQIEYKTWIAYKRKESAITRSGRLEALFAPK